MYPFLLSVFCYDLWFYISHRWLHTNFGYKWIHRHHHSVKADTMGYSDTYVAHLVEGPLQSLGAFFPLVFVPFSLRLYLYVFLFLNLRGMLRHDVRMTWLVGNHHVLHHKYPQCNYGDLWLDWMLGTKHPNWNEYKFGIIYN